MHDDIMWHISKLNIYVYYIPSFISLRVTTIKTTIITICESEKKKWFHIRHYPLFLYTKIQTSHYTEQLFLVLLSARSNSWNWSVFRCALDSFQNPIAFSCRSLAHSHLHSHSVISQFVHLCWWFDYYWNALCKMFYLSSRTLFSLRFHHHQQPPPPKLRLPICRYLDVSFRSWILFFFDRKLCVRNQNKNKNNLRALCIVERTNVQGV